MNILIVGDSEAGAVQPFIDTVRAPDQHVEFDFKVGSTIEAWSNGEIQAALARHAPADLVIVFLGTNNFGATSLPNVQPILSAIAATGAQMLWVGPTSVQGKSWPINDLLRNAVTPYVDTEALGIPLRDGIHPTAAGAVQWLHAIWARLPSASAPQATSLPLIAAISVALGIAGYLAWQDFQRRRFA